MSNLHPAETEAEAKYRRQVELMRKIHTAQGFYQYYFDQIPNFDTYKEVFEHVNSLYEELFGSVRYSSYETFRATQYQKKKR